MVNRRNRRRCSWVAILAAYALVVQALLGGLMLGASASPGAAGVVLCLTDGPASPSADAPAGPHRLPDCCLAGCPMFGHALPPAPLLGALALLGVEASPESVSEPAPRVEAREGRPANPRAPPVAA
ncbi:MAG: hypothetical protein J0H54_05640 [Rhizobiales bacterium]|nr:hypothetical protein [Hyphomicrobiales bacterium]